MNSASLPERQKSSVFIQAAAQPGYVRIGSINVEKYNPEKLEDLV